MSFESKDRLLTSVKKKVENFVTVTQMEQLIDVLLEELASYEVEYVKLDFSSGPDDITEAYLEALKVEGRSEKTIKMYRYIIKRFMKFIKVPVFQVSVFDIRKYLSMEKERGISSGTLDWYRQIFRTYFGWMYKEGIIKKNPVFSIGVIKSKKKVRDIFSSVDMELMKNACKQVRDVAIITFLNSTGCRVSEMVNLNITDVNTDTLECKVLGKGNKERIVYMDPVAAMFLSKYLSERNDDNEALFTNRYKNRFQDNGIRKMLKEIERISGVSNVHPHKFRRTLATNLIRKGMSIEKVKTILGHDKIETTMEYIVLDNNDIKNEFLKNAS